MRGAGCERVQAYRDTTKRTSRTRNKADPAIPSLPLGDLLNRIGLLARRSLESEDVTLLLAHERAAERRDVGEFLHAHVSLFAADNRVLVPLSASLFLDGHFGVEADLVLLLAVGNDLGVLHQLFELLDALFSGCL